jgi:pilus assembly protein CpaF
MGFAKRLKKQNSADDAGFLDASTSASSEDPSRKAWIDLKSQLRSELVDILDAGDLGEDTREQAFNKIKSAVIVIAGQRDLDINPNDYDRLANELVDEIKGFGPLEALIARDDIADIMVNGHDKVYIEVGGKVELSPIKFSNDEQLLQICQRIVRLVGRRVDESSPICYARLLDGSRVNVIIPPLAINGPTLTIRKFRKDKLTINDLVKFRSITPDAARLLQIIGRVRCNVLISGGTGSGKTTLLNCLTAFIDHDERIITCEDAAELQLQQDHVVSLETRPPNIEGGGQVTMTDLVKNCLRMRPERIIVGEVRGGEAFDLLQAMNTGHDGSMGTLHANDTRQALSRLESMIIASPAGSALPLRAIREMISSSVDIVVQASRLNDGRRVITAISEVTGMEEEVIVTQDLVKFQPQGRDENNKIIGHHKGTGITTPHFMNRAQQYGMGDQLLEAMTAINTAA